MEILDNFKKSQNDEADSVNRVRSLYGKSGVSSQGAETALFGLLKHVLPTRKFSERYPLAADIGYFANTIGLGNGEGIAFCTDGVGTKVIVAELLCRYDTIGIDCVAMNVNDIILRWRTSGEYGGLYFLFLHRLTSCPGEVL